MGFLILKQITNPASEMRRSWQGNLSFDMALYVSLSLSLSQFAFHDFHCKLGLEIQVSLYTLAGAESKIMIPLSSSLATKWYSHKKL